MVKGLRDDVPFIPEEQCVHGPWLALAGAVGDGKREDMPRGRGVVDDVTCGSRSMRAREAVSVRVGCAAVLRGSAPHERINVVYAIDLTFLDLIRGPEEGVDCCRSGLRTSVSEMQVSVSGFRLVNAGVTDIPVQPVRRTSQARFGVFR